MKFHEIDLSEAERKYVLMAMESGHLHGRGENTHAVENSLKKSLGVHRILMTTSGTHALELAVRLCGLMPGDEVIMPSYTFPSTANAVLAVGAVPVFAAVSPAHMSLEAEAVSEKITNRTKAVIAVHYGGACGAIDAISELCAERDLMLIEDAAQAFGSTYKGKPLGSWGDFGCLSFHGTKNDVSGEGGALIIPDKSKALTAEAERILEKGTDRMAFLRGDKPKYEWTGYGSSYVPSDILVGILRGQLESHEQRLERRRDIVQTYVQALKCYEDRGVRIFQGFESEYDTSGRLSVSSRGRSNAHLFYVMLENTRAGQVFEARMKRAGIPAIRHFVPLHCSKMGEEMGYKPDDFPFEADVFDRLFRIPVHTKLTQSDVKDVVEAAKSAIEAALEVRD